MEFIGTEVGIKIRSAIKAKLTELGKTVDDELIDYIMVMVANKKEENQMARDLQPFLESDTVKFTSWLHKVLQKLEQVTVIVTDEEFKIASSAFGKVSKKRKSTDSTGKKKIGSKEEPKEKKKKIKHEKHKISKSNAVSKIQVDKQAKFKHTNVVTQQATSSAKVVKTKKEKIVLVDLAEACRNNPPVDFRQKLQRGSVAKKRAVVSEDLTEPEVQVTKVDTSSTVQQTTDNTTSSLNAVRSVVPVQRPVMMVSDDDDDDDDFINIKTDMAEEDELLDEEKNQRALALASPEIQPEEQDAETFTSPIVKSRTVVVDTSKADTSNALQTQMPATRAETVRQALVAPRSVVATTKALQPTKRVLVRTTSVSHQKTASSTRSSVIVSSVRSSVTMPQRPSILSRVGAVLKRKASALSDDGEEEEEDAKNGSVASVVKVKPRPKVPAGSQAPKNLLLRAMADAHRSLASAPPREAQVSQSNRSPLFTRKFRDRQQNEQHERIAITLPNVHDPSDQSLEVEEDDHVMEEQQIVKDEVYVPELVAAPNNSPADVVVYSPSPIAKASAAKNNTDVSKTEFLVTLDGYKGFDSYDRDCHSEGKEDEEINELAEDEELEELEESSEMVEIKPRRQKIVFNSEEDISGIELESSKKSSVKSLDRCRFWPACRSGDACTFHHPTQTCKSFPNCSFGDRCLYIHPNCKFDATCTRKDCPFTHASPRNLAALPVKPPMLVARPVAVAVQTCLFFPNCSNVNCRFYHPVPCRYGRLCSKPDCSFIHSDVPPKEKMKWINTER